VETKLNEIQAKDFDVKVSDWMYYFATTTKKKYLIIRTQQKAIKQFGKTFKSEVTFVPELSNKKVFRTGKERTINLIRVRGTIIRHGLKSSGELLDYFSKNKTEELK